MSVRWGVLLDRSSNLILIVAILFGVVALRHTQQSSRQVARELYTKGERVPQLKELQYDQKEATLILFINSRCHFCSESMLFYRTLVDQRTRNSWPLQIVALSVEPKDELSRYLADNHLTVDCAVTADPAVWRKFSGTPTLLLINKTGAVENIWRGKLTGAAEGRLVSEIATKLNANS